MKIYTKAGDAGETSLYGGRKIPKDELRIHAYGGVDELNAWLGMALAEAGSPPELVHRLRRIQAELFQLGAELATPVGKTVVSALLQKSHITAQENEIDQMEAELKPLKNFILPGGTRMGAALHLARTVCRRVERRLVTLHRHEPLRSEVLQYFNRLSDYLFVSARWANHQAGVADIDWHPPSKS